MRWCQILLYLLFPLSLQLITHSFAFALVLQLQLFRLPLKLLSQVRDAFVLIYTSGGWENYGKTCQGGKNEDGPYNDSEWKEKKEGGGGGGGAVPCFKNLK